MAIHLKERICKYCNNSFSPSCLSQIYCSPQCRFWAKVDIKKTYECWLWQASLFHTGYGLFMLNGKSRLAHRVSWEFTFDKIPQGIGYHGTCICHNCDNKKCVNPNHLFLGTHQNNMDDMRTKDRQINLKGEKHGMAKLNESQVIDIRKRIGNGEKIQALSQLFNVAYQTIHKLYHGKTWKHI